MAASKKSVSIIIPNYNGQHLLAAYLPYTISAIKNAGVLYELIVVDDCSTDASVAFLQTGYPEITVLTNPQNKGFSHTCNRGIAAAANELILLLNSDVKLKADYFEYQWKYFTRDDTFGVMGRIVDMEGERIQDAARMPKLNGLKLKTDYFYYTDEDGPWSYTFYLSGANALIDAKKLKSIGGFYELFSPFYCEDMELCLRAWRLNWKCYYEHQSVCGHQVSASTKNYQSARGVKSIYYRNRFYMHALHLNGWALAGWYLQITLIDLLPKLLAAQWWIWKSYTELLKNQAFIADYKRRLTGLMAAKGSKLTIVNVIRTIRASAENKKLTRFKP